MAVKERGSFYDQEYFVSPPLSVRLYRTYLKLLRFIWPSKARKTVITAFMTPRINKKGVINRYEKSNLLKVGETFYHHIEEHDIHVYKEGTPKVLLVYGWESSFTRFETVMATLRKNGLGFLIFDHPAHGKSSGKINHAMLSKNIVEQLLDLYPTINSVIGHSFGGGVSFISQENNSQIEKLVTIGSPTHYDSVTAPFFLTLDLPPKAQEYYYQDMSAAFGRKFKDYNLPEVKTKSQFKYLSIHDKNDMVIPYSDAVRMKESLNGRCELLLTENLGHHKIMHDQIVIDRAVSFLKD